MPSASLAPDTLLLALNSGSSSLKLGLFRSGTDDVEVVAMGSAEGIGRGDGSVHLRSAAGDLLVDEEHVLESQQDALGKLTNALQQHFQGAPAAIGHRFVHGGPHLRTHQAITPAVRTQLQEATDFAPLHIPLALRLVEQTETLYPGALQVACFDTAFHHTMPPVATHLPLSLPLFEQGILRYGFHGLSYESVVARLGPALPPKAIFAHLGNGSSLAAVRSGRSLDTTMGLTPTGGIPMSTRSGDLDPGVFLYLLRQVQSGAPTSPESKTSAETQTAADALEDLLNSHSGLAALSGGEANMQELLRRVDAGNKEATLAVDVFCTAIRKTIGAYAALLSGVDLLVFTGGIGQRSAEIRRRVCEPLDFLGLAHAEEESDKIRILPAEEEKQIARHCRTLVSQAS